MSDKPITLRLADALEGDAVSPLGRVAAAELRRLHAENEALRARDEALLRECLDAMEDLHRTGDTQVFDLCVADVLLPVLRERLGIKKGGKE